MAAREQVSTLPPGVRPGSVGPREPRIERASVEIHHRRYVTAFDISSGSSSDLISVTVKLESEGVSGYGETTPMTAYAGETAQGLRDVLESHLFPALTGRRVFDVAGLHQVMGSAIRGRPLAKSAVDIALHDLQGKLLNVPVTTLLGGRLREEIELAWVVGLSEIDDAVAEAVAHAELGFRHLKVKGGVDPRRDLDLVRELASALPSGVAIALDANEGYEPTAALPIVRQLEAAGLALIEQPVPAWDLRTLHQLTDRLDLLVAADESLYSTHDAMELARTRACDVLNIKVLKVGGLHPARQIAAIAEAEGLAVKVGSMPELGVATLAAAHFAASTPVATVAADLIGPLMVDADLLSEPRLDKVSCPGRLRVPEGPGIGFRMAGEA